MTIHPFPNVPPSPGTRKRRVQSSPSEGAAFLTGATMAKNKPKQENNLFELRKISPLTPAQEEVFDAYNHGNHLLLHGYAGTGKTFVSLYLALRQLLMGTSSYRKILIIRSVVPSREMGFLPGTMKEKIRIYEEPYKEICDKLFGRGDGYDILKLKNLVEFNSTSFLRGLTFEKTIVIADEIENMTFQELDTITTRMGEGSRLILCGDYRQSDLEKQADKAGLAQFMQIIGDMDYFTHIEFEKEDIVRSGLVKEYIIKKTELGF